MPKKSLITTFYPNMRRTRSVVNPGRRWPWLLLLAGGAWLLWQLAPVLAPFAAGAALAYLTVPLVDRLEARRIRRDIGAMLVLLLASLVLLLLLMLIIPMLVSQVSSLIERLPSLVDRAELWGERVVSPWLLDAFGLAIHFDSVSVKRTIASNIGNLRAALTGALPALTDQGMALLTFLSNLFLTPVVAFYFLRDWHGIVERCARLLPDRWRDETARVAGNINHIVGEFLRGQLAVMLIMAVLYGTGWRLAGLQSGIAIGVVAGLLVCIPYVGAFIGVLLATLAALLQFGDLSGLLIVWAVYAAAQTAESFYITPKLVGDRIGLHPVLVIFALMAFGALFGFIGVLVALPASAVLQVLWHEGLDRYFASRWYRRRIGRHIRP